MKGAHVGNGGLDDGQRWDNSSVSLQSRVVDSPSCFGGDRFPRVVSRNLSLVRFESNALFFIFSSEDYCGGDSPRIFGNSRQDCKLPGRRRDLDRDLQM
ncbi:hypothetical protein TIFTF001_012598 [Ficus carica]|uniref:Uncharacterized protein n=1 Tax=Ficus carica TaxID=3494 RepID=A0AA88D5C0_FICCA|nr:hypothetical protein TIFTF001_012598 [Ficus carica]